MIFNPEQLEQIRLCILRHLAAASSVKYGISTALLLQAIRNEGFRQLESRSLVFELEFLASKGWIQEMPKVLSPENQHWHITDSGKFFYEQQSS